MSEIEVRIAKASDLEAARHVIIQTWLNTYVPIHKGVGQRLFDFALSSFEHAQNVSLEVDESNDGAIRFYQRNGLVITDRTDHCGNDSDITALIMSARCENLKMS